ncbi:hypothetical protein Vretifemale_410 [Volvox reticuliferus]|nr:hypothetical protein Vretifemale_410 [Volvox reticuliferus]
MRLPALDLALNQLMRERVPGSVAAPVTTASAMAAEQRSRSAVGSCWRQVVHHSGCAEADASGRVVAAAEATGPRNAIDLDAEADEGSLSSTSGSDADVRVWGGRQLLNAEQLLSLVASSGPAPGPGNLHGPGEPGSGAAVPEIEFARPSAARTLGLRNGASNETGEDARPWTHCVAGLSSLNGRPRPFGTPRALLGMTNSVSGQNRRQRPRHPGGLSHGDHVSTAPRDLGAGAQGGTDVAAAAGAAARLPLLLWGNRFSNPEFTERLQRLLMRRAASMENGRSDAEHYPVWAMPAPATAAASGPRVSQARQSMASPAAPPLSAATLASSPLRAPPAASFEPRLLRLPNTELGVTALNMLSGPTPRPSVGQRVTAAAGMSNGGADVRPLLASAAGAVTAAAASGSPGSGLWGDRYDEEEWQRPIMAMQDDTGDLPAIGATTLQSAFQSEDEGGAPTSNPAHMGGLRGASNRLGQLRASSLFEGRRRVQRRQQRAGRQAWQEHSTDSHVLDSNYSSDGSSGLCHYYYSDGNTDHRALVNQLNPSARVPLVDLVFPRIGTLPSSGGSSMLGTRHVGSPAQVMGNPMSTSLMEAPWGVRHMDLPQRRSRSSLGGLGAGHPRDDSAASASWENPSKHRPTQLAGSGEVGSSSGSTVSTSSEMPDLVSDSDSSPEWEWPHVEHQPQRPTLWRQRRHGLIGPALLGLPPGFVPLAAVDCSGLSMGTWSGVMNRRARATYTSQEEDADADTQSPTGFSSDFHTAREGSPAVAAALQMMVTEGSDNAASLPQAVADAGPSASGWRANTDPPGVSSDPEERSNNTPYSRLVMPRCFAQMDVGSNADTCSNADSELEEIAARLSHPVASVSRELRNSEAVACGDELPRLVVPNARGAAAGEGISPEPALSVSPSEAIVPESDSVFADVANVDAWAQSPPELIVGDNSHGEYSSWHSLASSRRSLRQRLGSQVALPDAVDAAGLIARTVAQECMDRSEAFGGPSSRRPQHIEHEDVRARLAWPFSDADGCTSDGSDLPTYWWASPRDRQPIEGICFPGSARNAGSPDRGGVEEDLGSIEMPPSSCSTDEDIEANGTVAAADGDSSDGDLLPPALVDREDEEALPPALVDSEDEEALPPALVDSEDEEALPPALVDSEETSAPDDESEGQSTVPFLIHEDRSSTSTGNDGNGDSRPMEGGSIADESDGQLQVARDLWVDEEYEQDYGDRGNTPSFSNRRHWVTGERVFGHSVSSEMDSDNGLPDVLSSSELEPFLHSRADRGQAGGGIGTAHVNPIAALSTLSPNSLARSQPDSRAISIPSGNRQLLQSSTRLPPIGSTVAASHSRTYALPGVTPAGIRSESAGASSLSVYRRMAEQMYLETTTFAPSDQDGGTANSDISSDSMPPLVSLNSPHSGSRGSSGRSSLADNDAYEPRTSGPAVVRRRRAWAEYQGFPSSQRQQDASLPFAAGTTATVTATEPAPPRSLRGSPPAPSQRTANVSTSVTGTTDELTSTETDSTWGAAVEALLRVLIDVRSGDRVSAGAGGSVASRAARSVSGSIAHMPTTTATLNGPQPHPIAAGNGAGSSSANGSGNSSRVGPPSQIVASLVRIPADVLSNVPPGSVLSITIPAGGLSSSIRGGSSNISLGGSGGGSRPGSNTTAARILQLGALSSFPLSWRSYLPAEENSGRHPNDYPGLPGIYDERDIPPWAARFAPRVPPELPTLRDTTAGSDSGGAQQVAVSSETRTTQADVQQDANVVEDNSTYQMRSMPASWEAQWDDFSFSTADEDDGDDNTSTNYMEANRDVEERNCQAAGDSEGQQCDTESLPDSLPDLLPLEESPAATESSAAARLRGLRDPALPEMTAANASGREMALPPPNNASQGELPPRQYFVEMLAGMEPPVRRVDRRDGEGNVGRESGGAAAQAVSLDDARAAAYHLHSAAAHMPHELQHLQDGSRDRSPAPIDVPGAGEATGTRERRVAAPDLVGSGEGDCNVGVVEMLTELEGLPGLPPIELQRQLQQPDGRQPQLREHNSVGPVLQGAGEPLHPGAGVTAAMAVSDLHEGPESRHVRRGSAPARVPLPPMPEGAGAAPPQHSLVAGARGLNTVSRYAGPDMEDGNAEPESLLLGAVAVQETLPTAASEFGRGVVAARVAPGTAREPGSVPARRNAVTYPRSVLLDMLEALRSSETAASSSLVGSSHGSIMAAAAAHVPNATAATSMQMVGMGLGLHERATRSASHVAATAALLRDDSFVAQLLGGLPGVAISPPACCVQETVRMLQSGEEGAGMGSKMELCNLIID